nr:MAG TPA: hypothetical protein [Caudoviricetes sp.]
MDIETMTVGRSFRVKARRLAFQSSPLFLHIPNNYQLIFYNRRE